MFQSSYLPPDLSASSAGDPPLSVSRWVVGLNNLRQRNITVLEYMEAFQQYLWNHTDGVEGIINKIEDFASKKELDICFGKGSHGCRDTVLFTYLSGYMYPLMLLLCLLGNSLNIAVYSLNFMRKSVTVKILAARALTNSLFVLFLGVEAMKTLHIWDPHLHADWERAYWNVWPYLVTVTNTFGSCAMWITVLMTLERYLYVVYPMRSKLWCTNRNLYISFALVLFLSVSLQILFPVIRYIHVRNCTDDRGLVYLVKLRTKSVFLVLESVYHFVNLILAILVPMLLMIFMSLVIAWRLLYRHVALSHYTAQKRCITRITLSTTAAHLILEFPSLVVFLAGALHGPGLADRNHSICIWKIVSNFLGTCNASILFFIYLLFSDHFRSLLLIRLRLQNRQQNPLIFEGREETSEPARTFFLIARSRSHQRNVAMAELACTVSRKQGGNTNIPIPEHLHSHNGEIGQRLDGPSASENESFF